MKSMTTSHGTPSRMIRARAKCAGRGAPAPLGEKAGEEEEAADDEQGCWTQEYREYVFESRRNRGFVDLVVGPAADRGIAHNGMVSDDPSHQQRPEVVRRNDSGRPLPLVSARGAEAGLTRVVRRGLSMPVTLPCCSARGQRRQFADKAARSTTQSVPDAA